jgi:adenylate kinase
MIFISGVHGVGKSYFCNMVKEATGIESYSASALITQKKHFGFAKDKLIPDIDDNQQYLLQAVSELRASGQSFILDGHFCLLNESGEITRIPYDIFTSLKPDAIILLTEASDIIAARRLKRDGIEASIQNIDAFQQEECTYAKEVAADIGAKLFVSGGAGDLAQAITFIKSL